MNMKSFKKKKSQFDYFLKSFSPTGNPFVLCWNFCVFIKSAGRGCLATADAMGAQATERFGKKEKAACLQLQPQRLNRRRKKHCALKRSQLSVFSRAPAVFSWLKTLWWTRDLSILNAFLGMTCERPHEMHKGKKTKTKVQKKETITITP